MICTRIAGLAAVLSVALLGCQKAEQPAPPVADTGPAANVTAERLLKAADEPSQWMTYGGTYSEQRFSALKQVNRDNVKTLGLAWFADYDTNLTQAGTPLYIDGVVYVSTAWSKVYAFDAKTGKQLWQYNPKTQGEWAVKVCCGIVNRGIAAYNGKIYVGTLDARLVAIDAKSGKEVWSTPTFDPAKREDPLFRFAITMAPRVAKGKVFIGASGGEFGVRGFIAAFDAETGKESWRFYTVPGNPADGFENEAMKKAAATWSGDWWKVGGGGTVWDAAIYDPVTDLLYFGTGNGTPWNQSNRDPKTGDNLYLASIIAVKPDTGEYVWHYQTTPQDTWDYDSVSPMMTVDLQFDGKQRHVLLQPCKNGYFYVLDAATGELLSAKAFTEVNWSDGVDMKTGRPKVIRQARYQKAAFNLAPGVQGGHGWHSNAYSPDTGLIYIATQQATFPMVPDPKYQLSSVGYNLGIDFAAQTTYYPKNPTAKNEFVGYLQAWDPATGKQVWKGDVNQGPTGGALATAGGLVFQGSGGGQELRAFDARTGEKLWSFKTQTGILPGPITFELDGQQYVAASVGGAVQGGYFAPNHSRMLVFALNGKAVLPEPQPYTQPPLDPPPATASADVVKQGTEHYSKYCAACHGTNGQTRGSTFPDLTRTPLLHAQQAFDQVVLQGARAERGMASFGSVLQPADSAAIRAYIVARATELKNAPPLVAPGAPPPREQPRQAHEDPTR
jgi:alcohol dehydrogenase (cytochrome c)/quinohemoprotein ethanol dehydrogenase